MTTTTQATTHRTGTRDEWLATRLALLKEEKELTAGIAVALLDAGIPLWLLETDQAALERGRARIAGIYDGQVKKGKLTANERDRRLALLRPTLSYDAIGSN
jgi:predicted dithiol-disulfide oxidoreductase (DUF899 family)